MGGPAEPVVGSSQPANGGPTANEVQRTRAWTGLWVVVIGDVAIALAAILGVVKASGNANTVSVLSSAFTAIGTMTTAYFGIRASSNTAESAVNATQPR